jgi:DNA-directed RNA polymerase subunit E'/Rpb7
MNNKIYLNLKKNLERKIKGKCYKNYGYIQDIYEIVKHDDGIIHPENPNASAVFNITFSCRLCLPLKNTQIICKVHRVNKMLVTLNNGPILVIITKTRMNDKVFFTDNNNNFRYKKKDKSYVLKPNDYVRVSTGNIQFNDGDNKIRTIGFLEDMATDNEIEFFFQELYNRDDKLVDFEEYIKQDDN